MCCRMLESAKTNKNVSMKWVKSFVSKAPFLLPPVNIRKFWCFKGVKKRYIRNKWVNKELLKISILFQIFCLTSTIDTYEYGNKGCVWSAMFYFCGDACLWKKPNSVCVITMTFIIGFYVEMSLKITSSQMPSFLASQQISFVSLIWWQLMFVLISD